MLLHLFPALLTYFLSLINLFSKTLVINPIQDGLFWGCSRMWEVGKKAPSFLTSITYPTMIKLGTVIPKEDPKTIRIM